MVSDIDIQMLKPGVCHSGSGAERDETTERRQRSICSTTVSDPPLDVSGNAMPSGATDAGHVNVAAMAAPRHIWSECGASLALNTGRTNRGARCMIPLDAASSTHTHSEECRTYAARNEEEPHQPLIINPLPQLERRAAIRRMIAEVDRAFPDQEGWAWSGASNSLIELPSRPGTTPVTQQSTHSECRTRRLLWTGSNTGSPFSSADDLYDGDSYGRDPSSGSSALFTSSRLASNGQGQRGKGKNALAGRKGLSPNEATGIHKKRKITNEREGFHCVFFTGNLLEPTRYCHTRHEYVSGLR